jgi:Do/DeqQ family serine protease
MGRIRTGIIGGVTGGILMFLGVIVFHNPEKVEPKTVSPSSNENNLPAKYVTFPGAAGPELAMDFTYAAENTLNTVVHVTNEFTQNFSRDPFYEFFYGPRGGNQTQKATGSGVIISEDGYIVTNNHVIADADNIQIMLNNNESYKATLVGADPSTDIALLKIDARGLAHISFGNSDKVRIGEWVLAVGNPFNLNSTVTAGIVSAKARDIDLLKYDENKEVFPLESFIQTDAAVNPGNSGGALVNVSGELIGINTAIASKTGSYAGYSFAVPSAIVKKVTDDLLEFGMVQRAFIGVALTNIDQEIADNRGFGNTKGVLITGLIPDGAASDAGIKEGDVIVKIGSLEINSVPALQEQIGKFRPGDQVSLTIRRDGSLRQIDVVLRNREGKTRMLDKLEIDKYSALGATFKKITTEDMKTFNIKGGIKVTTIGPGKLRSAGVKEGMIITKVDQKHVTSPEELVNFLNTKKGGVLLEGITANGGKAFFGFGL